MHAKLICDCFTPNKVTARISELAARISGLAAPDSLVDLSDSSLVNGLFQVRFFTSKQ